MVKKQLEALVSEIEEGQVGIKIRLEDKSPLIKELVDAGLAIRTQPVT